MPDISQNTINKTTRTELPVRIELWEPGLTLTGGERFFFCNEANENGESITWQGRQYQLYLSTTGKKWVFRNLGGDFHARGLITRRLSSSNPARAYI
ncbi:hypothetical protein HVH02_004322 [Salmonella enterica]|nr:hypothetical protein [Salmonella enterica]